MSLPGFFSEQVKASKPKAKRKAEPESKVKVETKKVFAEEAPEAWYYMPVQSAYGKHGIPDFVACVPVVITPEMVGQRVGLFVTVETKASDNDLSPNQVTVDKEIREAGGFTFVPKGRAGLRTLQHWLRRLYKKD